MVIKGYKAFNKDKTNRYGVPFEEGKTYKVEGKIKFGNNGNGFHLCKELSDVFRYVNARKEEVLVAEVIGRGNYQEFFDEYEGYYEMYSVEELEVVRFLSREEIIEKMMNASDFQRYKFVRTFLLTEKEKIEFLRKYRDNYLFCKHILYYQYQLSYIYSSEYEIVDLELKKVLSYGQNSNKGC